MECSECEFYPKQDPKYYCFDSNCQVLLCWICLKRHPKEHESTITTIENVKLQTFRVLKEDAQNQLERYLEEMMKSTKMNSFFREAFGTLMRQNTTVNFDQEDVADVLADNLKRRCFPEGVKVEELPEKNFGIGLAKENLISFDFERDDSSVDEEEDHQETAEMLCKGKAEFYDRTPLEVFYVKSNPQVIFWNTKFEHLLCKVLGQGGRSVWYEFPETLNSFTILNSAQLLFLGATNNKLIVYSAEEVNGENYGNLKISEEFQHERIVFFASDNIDRIFVVSETLQVNICSLKIEENKLELCKLASFKISGIPKKIILDRVSNLLFILYDHMLEAYKYSLLTIPHLIQKFVDQIEDFSWHQKTRRLLIGGSNKLYQFDRRKFRLVRTIDKKISCKELIRNKILGSIEKRGFYLISQKNPESKALLNLPSCKFILGDLRQENWAKYYDHHFGENYDVQIGQITANYGPIRVLAESADDLLIFANISYSQSASQRIETRKTEYGGSLYIQRLIKYDLTKNIEIEDSNDAN